jgi:hypothetical protein
MSWQLCRTTLYLYCILSQIAHGKQIEETELSGELKRELDDLLEIAVDMFSKVDSEERENSVKIFTSELVEKSIFLRERAPYIDDPPLNYPDPIKFRTELDHNLNSLFKGPCGSNGGVLFDGNVSLCSPRWCQAEEVRISVVGH